MNILLYLPFEGNKLHKFKIKLQLSERRKMGETYSKQCTINVLCIFLILFFSDLILGVNIEIERIKLCLYTLLSQR